MANIRWIKPLPEQKIKNILSNTKRIITTEENVLIGGFGSSISEIISDNDYRCSLLRNGIDDIYVKPGDKEYLSKITKIDEGSLIQKIKAKWPDLF